MDDTRPAEATPAPPPVTGGAPSPGILTRVTAGGARFFDRVFNWPRSPWPVPTGTSLFILSLLVVAVVEFLPKGLSAVTMTVSARTEVLELELQPERTYVWWLPVGRYSLVTPRQSAGCEPQSRIDVTCSYTEPTAVTIKGGGTVRFEAAATENPAVRRFSMALTPRGAGASAEATPASGNPSAASVFEIRSGDGALVATEDLVTFEAYPQQGWRIPLIVERVQIGESLSESLDTSDALATAAHQPILTEGGVRMFARSLGFEKRYQIQEERFDPADVVQIPADAASTGLLLGLLSLPAGGGDAFDLTLHTDVAEVFVRRLGAEHRIGVSTWSIVSNLPLWLALWVVWVAFVILANYHATRLAYLRGQQHDKHP